jgi:hypothetical protein
MLMQIGFIGAQFQLNKRRQIGSKYFIENLDELLVFGS